MSATTEHVFIEARSLPTKSRAALAHKLLTGLGQDDLSVAIEEAGKLKALDRRKASDAAQLTERDADAVMRKLAAKLK